MSRGIIVRSDSPPGSGGGVTPEYGAWTPAAYLGAVVFVGPTGIFARAGRTVTVWGQFLVPANAVAAPVRIVGLPYAMENVTANETDGPGTNHGGALGFVHLRSDPSLSALLLVPPAGGFLNYDAASGIGVRVNFTYRIP